MSLNPTPIVLKTEDGETSLQGEWPELSTIMEGMIDGKLVKQATDDILAITLANGHAEYQISTRGQDGTMVINLLPGWTLEPGTDDASEQPAPARTVDANGRHIA